MVEFKAPDAAAPILAPWAEYRRWRRDWIRNGMKWSSKSLAEPAGRDMLEQARHIADEDRFLVQAQILRNRGLSWNDTLAEVFDRRYTPHEVFAALWTIRHADHLTTADAAAVLRQTDLWNDAKPNDWTSDSRLLNVIDAMPPSNSYPPAISAGAPEFTDTIATTISLLPPDQGGRHSPIFTQYRPGFYFEFDSYFMGHDGEFDLLGRDRCEPGNSCACKIRFFFPWSLIGLPQVGDYFHAREGSRVVADGHVESVE